MFTISKTTNRSLVVLLAALIFSAAIVAHAQTTAFTYQGRLSDNNAAANDFYDFRFQLYNTALNFPTGQPVLINSVQVVNGSFTVSLDFTGSVEYRQTPNNRLSLEVAVRKTGSGANYTALTPRQPVGVAPFSLSALVAENAFNANYAQVANFASTCQTANSLSSGGASNFVQTNDFRLTNERSPSPGSANYLQNTTTEQANTNFNISGSGILGGNLQAFNLTATNNLTVQNNFSVVGTITGNGSGLTNLNASNISSGTLGAARIDNLDASKITTGIFSDAFLSPNVPRLNAANIFTADLTANTLNTPSNAVITNNQTTFNGVNGFLAVGTSNSGVIPATGAGSRMMWYGKKSAFRAGIVSGTKWDDEFVGLYSFATGFDTIASGAFSTAMGVSTSATGDRSTAMGRDTVASNNDSTAMGLNTTASGAVSTAIGVSSVASGNFSITAGYNATASGDYSTAMGYFASTNGQSGSFIYGDKSTNNTVIAEVPNEFVVRAAGGFRFRTSADLSTGCDLPAGSGVFQCTSSKTVKENFVALDGTDVLSKLRRLPVMQWNYIGEGANVRHIGTFAEDFFREFGLGTDAKSIGLLDIAGVNTAAIQALDIKVEQQQQTIERQQAAIDELRQIVCALKPDAAICRQEEK